MMIDLTEIITKRTFRRRGFVVVQPPAEARSCLIRNLMPRLIPERREEPGVAGRRDAR